MQFKICAIYDGRIKSFLKPFSEQHTGSAMRSFEEACSEPTSPFAKFPSDFQLYEIAAFDAEKGKIDSYAPVILLAAASDYVKKPRATVERLVNAPTTEASDVNAN